VSKRKVILSDCNPRWISGRYNTSSTADYTNGVHFDCPEGHADCSHAIPFTPALDGTASAGWQQNGAIWQRTGDTFETLSLSPSIRRVPQHASRAAAIADGCIAEHVTDSHLCAFHGFITNGAIMFCGDSR
jgi:hypothetical protein